MQRYTITSKLNENFIKVYMHSNLDSKALLSLFPTQSLKQVLREDMWYLIEVKSVVLYGKLRFLLHLTPT